MESNLLQRVENLEAFLAPAYQAAAILTNVELLREISIKNGIENNKDMPADLKEANLKFLAQNIEALTKCLETFKSIEKQIKDATKPTQPENKSVDAD